MEKQKLTRVTLIITCIILLGTVKTVKEPSFPDAPPKQIVMK